ncbi:MULTISPECIES: DUF397 domain-containing protein [Pseudonocardia]|uniref:DUF397 domain-containing protein n=2 Tax=Pseudonocardia TaxID=1847 RepID=A0A1Y2MLF0_PSEAH|nr:MULTISPECIES: DUF397 domain-containing protein [Pseudonocardia]OSY36094.1 hypothetical protein BG845_05609 [Pseudonocardia autotrophica]TDN77575.1 uncharacterized protein DUF397 [Pseudonocardia autotrophica]BBG01604.1 hypothetical protein Pdca_28130 [Pseudonocardia autotrophica]GEC25349.1 hypothetical protein PSA01_23780 [Pseudonocardia saturnea]
MVQVRSSFCYGGECVQVEFLQRAGVLVSHPEQPEPLYFTRGEWQAFIAGVKNGDFDLPD